MNDLDISLSANYLDIHDVFSKLSDDDLNLIPYGFNKAKMKLNYGNKSGKLILVTAINPTPYGEGKTTVSIGLNDALCKLGKKSVAVLRQPSMGPVFGMKGGATGGGYSQVIPMEDINLHFTGDFHAITSANNLLCSAIDNHIYYGNSLDIQKVVFNRCLDINDRALRNIKLLNRDEKFNITAASEIMALFCLSKSLTDLKERIGKIVIGYNSNDEEIYAKDLHIEGALTALLKDAFMPNLVQSLENNPVIIHGGPFANIAHGCNSLVATKLGLSLSDYVVTEAGFGSDLGAEKFFDIKCRVGDLVPDAVVLVATIRALKYNAFVSQSDILHENTEAVNIGLENLKAHLNNLKKFGVNIVVCLNKFNTDTDNEISVVSDFCKDNNVDFDICDSYNSGGDGSVSLANKVIKLCDNKNNFKYLYDCDSSIKEKIKILCSDIYHCGDIIYSENADKKISFIEKSNHSNLPICVAKTQYSLSDDASLLGNPKDYTIHVNDIELNNGAGFIVVILGKVLRMPGLPKQPNYEKIDLDNNGNIVGIF